MGIDYFEEIQIKKQSQFHELVHAAFVLKTDVSFYLLRPQPTEKEMSWLASTYPGSLIERGSDQGAAYCNITPKL